MSRHTIFKSPEKEIVVGWDNGCQTFFGICYDLVDLEREFIFNIGTREFEYTSVARLQEDLMAQFDVEIPIDVWHELEKDKAIAKPRTPLQERMSRYFNGGWAR